MSTAGPRKILPSVFTPNMASFFTPLRPTKMIRIGTWGAMASPANAKFGSIAGSNAMEEPNT